MKLLMKLLVGAFIIIPTFALNILTLGEVHLAVNYTAFMPIPGNESSYGLLNTVI